MQLSGDVTARGDRVMGQRRSARIGRGDSSRREDADVGRREETNEVSLSGLVSGVCRALGE